MRLRLTISNSVRLSALIGGVVVVALLGACNYSGGGIFSGAGGSASAALHIDEAADDRAVLTPLERPLKLDERFWLRLELNEPSTSDHVIVRVEYDAGAREYFELRDFRYEGVDPPWTIVAIPLQLNDDGDFNIALIVDSRKVADVKVTVEN